jgi:hypothetical protein
VLCALLAPVVAPVPAALAQSGGPVTEIRGGILAHDQDFLVSGIRREDGVNGNLELLFRPLLAGPYGTLRPALGGTFNVAGGTSFVYLDARYEIETTSGIFFGIGLGGAVHDGELRLVDPARKALGSRVLFHIPVEIGVRWEGRHSLSIYAEHVSNANLASANEGIDNIGVRYGYRF